MYEGIAKADSGHTGVGDMTDRGYGVWAEMASLLLFVSFVVLAGNATAASIDSFLRESVDTTYPALTGAVHRVAAGEDLQAALLAAEPGDVIELEAGAVYTGPFKLPRKPLPAVERADWILIRSGAPPGALPPVGERVGPRHAEHMAILEADSGPVIGTEPGAHHYRFEGVRIRPSGSGGSLVSKWMYRARSAVAGNGVGDPIVQNAPFIYNLVSLGTDAARFDDLPHHIVFDRCYFHGDPLVGARRGIALNSRHTAVINSYLADFKEVGFDSQAIAGWGGPGPFKIVNNYLEGAGENVMFGGAVPRIEGTIPADIEIRGNVFSKPLGWKAEHATYEGKPWTVKNLFELKNAERVVIEGNLFEYVWPHAQTGFAILFTVRNEDGKVPWATVSDVIFRNNVVRHVANGVNILGIDDNPYPSRKTARMTIDNNLFLDVGEAWGGRGTLFQLLESTEHVVISNNTAEHTGSIIITDGKGQHESFRFVDNTVPHNLYGIKGSGLASGHATLERDFPGAIVTGNVFIGADPGRYPENNEFPGSLPVLDTLLTKVDTDEGSGRTRVPGVNIGKLCSALSVANPSPVAELPFCASEK